MKKFLKIIICTVLLALYCGYIGYCVCKQPMNSDSATMLLYADDILSGNIFLSGWSLSGLTFLFTDLPFFVIGVAVFGVSLNAFRLAVFMMFLFMSASALAVSLYAVKNKWTALFIMAATGLFPTTYAMSNAFVHTAVFALVFLAALCTTVYERADSKKALILLGILTAMAVSSDGIALIMITIPAIILFLFRTVKKNTVISAIAGTAAGFIIEKLFLIAGGADINSLQQSAFIELDKLWHNISIYIEYFLRLINAYFFTKNIFSVKTLFFALKILVAFFALWIIYRAIKSIVKRTETDVVTAFLGIGFAMMTAILFITTINTDITAGRYIGFLPLLIGIVIVRFLDMHNITDTWKVIIIPVAIMLAATCLVPSGSSLSPYNTYSELADFLQKNNLSYGYTSFWDAAVINGYSENKVCVCPVEYKDGKIQPRVWFCKLDWYKKAPQFYIVRNDGAFEEEAEYKFNGVFHMRLNATAMFGINKETVTKEVGKPLKTLNFKNYSVMIYDKTYVN